MGPTTWWRHGRAGRRLARLAAAAAVVAAAAALAGTAAAGGHAQPVHPGTGYLALGDSVAFGYTPPAVTPPANYLDASNFVGYPEDVAADLGLDLSNASCPGETSLSLLQAGVPSNGCENAPGLPAGYRTVYPLHVSYSGTQEDYAVQYLLSHPRTRLVTLDVGANDVFLCQETTADSCTGSDLGATLQQVGADVASLLAAIRTQAHYHHDIVVLTYYALDYRDPTQVAGTQALNAALAAPALRYDAVLADGFGAFQAASAGSGGDPCAAGLLVPLPDGTCNVHPSPQGHHVLAAAIEQAIPHQ